MDDDSFRQLLDRLGLSWQGYAKVRKSVKKRIRRHMQELGILTMDEYLQVLTYPNILKDVEMLMSVSISRFFRDQNLWHSLKEEIIPGITSGRSEEIHAWSAGCALGQEPYSLAIKWDMLKRRYSHMPEFQIRATDINPDYLHKARGGVYRRSSLRGLSDEIKSVYFRACDDRKDYCVADHLKKYIVWEVHDLMREPPPAGAFQIIFLRNSIFTYYRKESTPSVFMNVLDRLDGGGFFIIGSHEKLPFQTDALSPFKGSSYIFQKT
ncbi:MAG: CheR family methyltransferase [Syntrophales bacterium]|jgi:chemotaxis protein methyltransferase CheR